MNNFYKDQVKKYGYWWSGNYTSWEDAEKQSIGYSASNIANQVKEALLITQDSIGTYELDGRVMKGVPNSTINLLKWIKKSAIGKSINVIDFGGSLGTTYYQLQSFLKDYNVRWNIIEQENFVEIGKVTFENDSLKFYKCIEDCLKDTTPNCFIASGSITYIEKPYDLLQSLEKYHFDWIMLDRISIITGDIDRLTIQITPLIIYEAIYPCWFLSENKLLKAMRNIGYSNVEAFNGDSSKYFTAVIENSLERGFIFNHDCAHSG